MGSYDSITPTWKKDPVLNSAGEKIRIVPEFDLGPVETICRSVELQLCAKAAVASQWTGGAPLPSETADQWEASGE